MANTTALNPGIAFYGGKSGVSTLYGADLGYNIVTGRYRTRLFSGHILGDVAFGRQQDAHGNPTQSAFMEFLTVRGDTGFVGIGTAAPNYSLEVFTPTQFFPGINILASTHPTSERASIGFGLNAPNPTQGWVLGQDRTGTGIRDMFLFDATNKRDLMYWGADGNVGVGTTAPAFKFDVQDGQINAAGGLCIAGDCKTAWSEVGGSGGAVSSVFGRTGAVAPQAGDYTWAQINKSASSLADITTRNAGDLNAGTVPIARLGTGTPDSTKFLRGDNTWAVPNGNSQWTSGTNNISYNAGNVGIGTATPGFVLDVSGGTNNPFRVRDSSGREYFSTTTHSGPFGVAPVVNLASGRLIIHHNGPDGNNDTIVRRMVNSVIFQPSDHADFPGAFRVQQVGGNPILYVGQHANGNVGIGTTTPVFKLDVIGEINATGLRINGTPISAGGAVTSVFGRTGAIVPQAGDYTWAQINKSTSSLADLATRNAGDLNAGTLPAARFPATLPAVSGANLTALNASNLTNGTVPTARLGSGTADSTKFLRGDNTWAVPSGTSQWTTTGSNNISYSSGNVGIGITNPGAKLEVAGNVSVTGTGNITATGTIEGGNIAAKYQDVAEWVDSSQELSPGAVVVLDANKSNQVIASTESYDSRVAGVISLRPGLVLGEAGEGRVLVATTGRVKVKVDATNGPIQIGDLLVTSDREGFAMKSQPVKVGGVRMHRPGTLIGKALEPLAKGTGEILVLLSLQ
ncbi:MAG TPA: peptidase G2 autoproteolytic cleavage domain-containing protein [Pyrinomonadaceae bacterium]|nr:peptidase G2 autoproteolytic cleavage domain-containing protein [Pyrinomonadaceae bacterium]